MKKTRENVEEMKSESLEDVYAHTQVVLVKE